MARKAAVSEKLTDTNIQKVIGLLSGESPITKKAACEILGITYNTTRLQTLIESYKQKKETEKKIRDSKKGKAATRQEEQSVVISYLVDGLSIAEIARSIYRSDNFVRAVLYRNGVPMRNNAYDYFHPPLIPEESQKDTYAVGERCYAVRYESLATIKHEMVDKKGQTVYCIWLEHENWQQHAYQPAYELMDLTNISKLLGVQF